MLNAIKILSNVENINHFQEIKEVYLKQGDDNVPFSIMLWQGDKQERYMPSAPVTVTIDFMRMHTVSQTPEPRTVTKTLYQLFPEDGSIFSTTLTEDDINDITTGGFKVTVEETSRVSAIYSKMTIIKDVGDNWDA